MTVASAYLMPHPPIMVEEVGGRETQKIKATIQAAEEVGREIEKLSPDTLVIISPHGPVFQDAICIYDFPLKGDLANFHAPEVSMEFSSDEDLKREIIKRAKTRKIPVVKSSDVGVSKYGFREQLDHGVTVPMHFISQAASEFRLLPMAFGMLPYEELYIMGKVIGESANALNKKVVVIASGDLSHRLTHDAPAGYDPQGKVFDETLISLLKEYDIKGLANLEPSLIEHAGECGLRSLWIMAGTLDGYRVVSEVLSYEGPFGVGYGVARFKPEGKTSGMEEMLSSQRQERIAAERKKEDPYVRLARTTLETYVREGKVPALPNDLPEEILKNRAGVFVSIKKHGELRGCIGTFLPTQKNIAEEIQRNAISAGCEDPRFYPVKPNELSKLKYSVDVLTKPESIDSFDKLDPKKYGVIVRKGFRSGLLLPDLEGVDTVEEQISIVLKKADIRPDEDYEMERFEVIRHN